MRISVVFTLGLLLMITSGSLSAAYAVAPHKKWTKLCDTVKTTSNRTYICLTHFEHLNVRTGLVKYSIAIRDIPSRNKKQFLLMLPKGVDLVRGARVVFDNGFSKKVPYSFCTPGGCTAEVKATADIFRALKSSRSLTIKTRFYKGGSFQKKVSLRGFSKALAGPSIDPKEYMAVRKAFLKRIRAKR